MKNLSVIIALFSFLAVFGQEDHTINATGEREVEKAYRMAIHPNIIDTSLQTPIVDYPLLELQVETKTDVEKINPASMRIKDKLKQLYNSYIKAGIGLELMPLGEFYYNSQRSRKYIYGAHIKHLSSWGNIAGYSNSTFDRTRGSIFGGINEKRYTLRGDFHYNNQGLHYYSLPVDTLSRDSIAQRYSDLGFSAYYAGHVKDSAKLNYKVGLAYNNFLSKKPLEDSLSDWRARENRFDVTSSFFYKLNRETYALDVNVRYNGYKYGIEDSSLTTIDTGIVLNNTIINLKPTITTQSKNNKFRARIGVDLNFDVHNKTSVYIYPIAEVKYSMFNDIFIPYVGLRGGLKQTTFKSLTRQNEFLLPNVNMLNEHTPIDFYGGIKGTLSRRVSFNAGVSFANVRNKALFITDTLYSIGNKFNVVFDTMAITTIEGSISYQLMEKLKVDGIGRFYSYSVRNNNYAWNLPQLQFILRGSYNLYDKFIFNLDLDLEGGRKALAYGPGEDISLETNGVYVKDLGFIADANLGAEYRYNPRISAFLQFNNIATVSYQRWYNTPVHGFQVMGGVTFRF